MHVLCNFLEQVEFPEAKIYEEALNVFMYENRHSRPDEELIRATGGMGMSSNGAGCHSDEEVEADLRQTFRTNKK